MAEQRARHSVESSAVTNRGATGVLPLGAEVLPLGAGVPPWLLGYHLGCWDATLAAGMPPTMLGCHLQVLGCREVGADAHRSFVVVLGALGRWLRQHALPACR